MKLRKKINKLVKNKFYLKKNYLFFIIIINDKFWALNKNLIKKEKFNYYNINKFITKRNLVNSLYKNLNSLIIENLGFLKIKKISSFKFLNSNLKLIGIKMNKNFYSLVQICKLKNFNYKYNIKIFVQFLKTLLKYFIKFF